MRFIQSSAELTELILEAGFMPLFPCGIPGFSVFEYTVENFEDFFAEDAGWDWRDILARHDELAYGKFFNGKAGVISAEWFPFFANTRRKGMSYEEAFQTGQLKQSACSVLKLYEKQTVLPRWEIFSRAGIRRSENLITDLEMRTYLITCGFERKRNKRGEEYGWPASLYCIPEDKFGEETIVSRYHESPDDSLWELVCQCRRFTHFENENVICRLLK